MQVSEVTLKAGTILYHGTDNDDFDEAADGLDGPAWLSQGLQVAQRFAARNSWGGQKRVIAYRLTEDVTLPAIYSREEMEELAEEHNIDLSGTEAIRDSFANSSLPGWVIPHNYPEGDDILLQFTNALEYQSSTPL